MSRHDKSQPIRADGLSPGPFPGLGPRPGSAMPSGSSGFDLPASIGRYRVEAIIGRGGMGVVYAGVDPALQRRVAIKMILADAVSIDPIDVDRFVLEARAAARLRHPAIVGVHEVGEAGGRPFIAMEHVEGESLEALLERAAPSPRRVAEIVRTVAEGLQHAHDHGILHRDVKPQNILIDRAGAARLTDFGLARDLDDARSLTVTGEALGTPSYMAPEQAAGRSDQQSAATDVWGLGAVLYRALVGRPPFKAATALQTIQDVLGSDPVAPRQLESNVNVDLETITMRCLEKDPARRYGTARALAADLDRFLAGEAIQARPLGPVERGRRWARRHPARVLVIALGLVVVVGTGAFLLAQGRLARRERTRLAAELIDDARRESDEARARLDDARILADRDSDSRDASDAALAASIDAAHAAERWRTLAREDPAAARAASEAWTAVAEIATATELWPVATEAARKVGAVGLDPAASASLEATVREARDAVARAERASILAVLERIRADESAPLEEARFELLGHRSSEAVAVLADVLGSITVGLREARSSTYLELDTPTALERTGSWGPIAGLARAVETLETIPPHERPDPATTASIAEAQRRLRARRRDELTRSGLADSPGSARQIIAAAQTDAIGRGRRREARIICELLGYIGPAELARAETALAEYLAAEEDETAASYAAIALARLESPRFLAVILIAIGRFGRVTTFTERTVRALPPDLPETSLEAATSEDHSALAAVHHARGHRERASASVSRALALDPRNGEASLIRALALHAEGRHAEADATFERAIASSPRSGLPYAERARVRVVTGAYRAALHDFDRAIALMTPEVPGYESILADRGAVKLFLDDVAGAEVDLREAVLLGPGAPRSWFNLGLACQRRGDVGEAIRCFDRAVDLDPGYVSAWMSRGDAHAQIGHDRKALVDYTRAIEIQPGSGLAWSRRGTTRRVLNDIAGARGDLDRAIEIDPTQAHAWANRGMVRINQGESVAAIADIDRAVTLAPNDVFCRWARSLVLLAAGRRAEAAAEARALLPRLRPDDPFRADLEEILRTAEGGR